MYIKKINLKNYRNYENTEFEFSSGVNILVGNNAQGKTNCAEAIFYCCTGYSPRITRDKQVINYEKDSASISVLASSRYGDIKVDINFTKKSKTIKVNGVELNKIGELIGNINSVFFNPNELKLIQEAPEDRRRFLDIAISQINKNYFYALSTYKKVLEERNNLLKSSDNQVIYDTIDYWNEQLGIYAKTILTERVNFVKELKSLCYENHKFLTSDIEEISISYESTVNLDGDIKNNFIKGLNANLEKDIILGYTTIGPQRDDLKIKIDNIDVRTFGSQGQQRTAALTLKLAELEYYAKKFNEYPVLILDDAFSELDKDRRQKLAEKIKDMQTIITCTDIGEEVLKSFNAKIFNIEKGKIV